MRRPRPRFTLRRMMLLVAVAGATLGGFIEYRRLSRKAAEYRAQAEDHAGIEQTLRMIVRQSGPDSPVDIVPAPGVHPTRFTAKTVAEFQAGLARKYERAA